MFDAARNFYSGQVPYRDFFYQYNLATVFLHGATLATLGLNIAALKKITVLFYALIALLIYLSCAIEGYKRSGFLLSIIWMLLSPFHMLAMNGYHAWSTVYMMFACMAGLFFLQLSIRKNQLVFSCIAGVFFCLAFWFKQVAAFQIIGVVLWLGFIVFLCLRSKVYDKKYLMIFVGFSTGGLIAALPFFSYLYAESAIWAWWTSAFEFNRYFSSESQTSGGLVGTLKILFPISKEMGYRSIFWALSPVLLCVVIFQVFVTKESSFNLTKLQKDSVALFAFAGFAGWVEYFPLPHPFHTQIFMAPMFVVIGILLGQKTLSFMAIKKYPIFSIAIIIFIVCGVYEGIRHIDGLNKKKRAYSKDSVAINLNTSFDGLRIFTHEEKSLQQFYKNLIELNSTSNSAEFIPLSVDPIRGLLPGKVNNPSEFKMGVNWTWPNEIVEPGFSEIINKKIILREQPIYADSLIYLPGYIPISLLEMKSPISHVHSLYEPQSQSSPLIVRDKKNSEIVYATDKDFDIRSRKILFDWMPVDIKMDLIPFDGISKGELQDVRNIHIIAIEDGSFPARLSALQLGYLKKVENFYGGNLSSLFIADTNKGGNLRSNISSEDKKNLALFMLSSGKLFVSQNHPLYASTLAIKNSVRPTLVELLIDNDYLKLLWSSKQNNVDIVNSSSKKENAAQTYIAMPHLFHKSEEKYVIIQIEMKNRIIKNFFYSFSNDQK